MPNIPDALRKPHDDHVPWLLRRVWDRLHERNQHFMLAIVGEEGSGKSYTAMRIAEAVDPTFTHDRVIFEVSDLLRTLKDGEHEPGNFYVLDEAGVQLGRRTWQQRGQVLTNQALQLIRNHNLGLIFTLPRLGELDSQAQGRLQAFIELTQKVDGQYVGGKWKFLDPDRTDQTGEIYKKFPRRRKNGKRIVVEDVKFSPPADDLTEPYEQRKREFQEQFYEKTLQELEGDSESGGEDDSVSPKQVVNQLENGDDLEPVISYHGHTGEPYIAAELLEMEYGLSQGDARKTKKLAEKSDDIDLSQYS